MKTILVLGAGRSSTSLIDYLLRYAQLGKWKVIVGDLSLEAAQEKIQHAASAEPIVFNIHEEDTSRACIALADVVISLLPANYHALVAEHCVALSKHLLTASYVSEEMKAFDEEAKTKGLLFLNECGLDPGIDHMSAMEVIDRIKKAGGTLTSFESFTGGLIAPEADPQNPWRYKFTWNPRNVVLAGQGTAKFLQQGQYKYIPYQQLFTRITQVEIPGHGAFDGYANRDSLKYISTYNLDGIQTMLRGTLRNKGFCQAWNILVQLGCCDHSYTMEGVGEMTHRDFINSFLDYHDSRSVEEKLVERFNLSTDHSVLQKLTWSGFFNTENVGITIGTPAQILEHILNKKWKLDPQDIDLVVMWHRFKYLMDGKLKTIETSLIAKGTNSKYTAMAKTVGLPLGIAAKLLLDGKILSRGVVIPIAQEFYEPILTELKTLGIETIERTAD